MYLAFGNPSASLGLDFSLESMGTTIWYNGGNVAASVIYKEEI